MKLVILDGHTENPGDLSWDAIKSLGLDVEIFENTAQKDVKKRAEGASILVTNKVPLDRETIFSLSELKYIVVLATGYNIIDTAAARERGIPVSNIPAYSTDSVCQLVFALLLELANGVALHNESVKNGDWQNCEYFCYQKQRQIELSKKTFGVIGFGQIGQRVASVANAFGMNVLVFNPRKKDYTGFGSVSFVTLDELARKSDVISLHCPLTKDTNGIINEEFLSKMKKTAFLINTSRGPLVCEGAVADALNTGKIAGFGADVLTFEPPKDGSLLIGAKNTVITPHIAWASVEARQRLMDIFVENVRSFLSGEPKNVVN